jgi:hypothetical protein
MVKPWKKKEIYLTVNIMSTQNLSTLLGCRVLIKKDVSVRECTIIEISPSGEYVKLSGPNINLTWQLASSVVVLEVLTTEVRQQSNNQVL